MLPRRFYVSMQTSKSIDEIIIWSLLKQIACLLCVINMLIESLRCLRPDLDRKYLQKAQ